MALLHYSSISDDKSRGEVVCSGLQYLYDESIKSIYLRLSVLGKGNYNSGGRTQVYMHSSNPQIELLFSRGEEKQGMAEILAERRTGNNFAKDFLANKQGMRRWGTQRENRLCGIAHLIFNGIRGIA